jgi:hypothetical protein
MLQRPLCCQAWGRPLTNLLAIVAPAGLVSFLPPLVRTGPEAYKGMIIEAFIIPTMILLLASIRWKEVFGVQEQPYGGTGPR